MNCDISFPLPRGRRFKSLFFIWSGPQGKRVTFNLLSLLTLRLLPSTGFNWDHLPSFARHHKLCPEMATLWDVNEFPVNHSIRGEWTHSSSYSVKDTKYEWVPLAWLRCLLLL